MFINGIVVFAHRNTYKVKTEKGIFSAISSNKLKENKVIVGDKVELKLEETLGREDQNLITKISSRKNTFIRPRVANIDNAIIVNSIIQPNLSDYQLDKLITIFQFQNVIPILIFTKLDLLNNDEIKNLISEYKSFGYIVLEFSNKFEKEKIKEIEKITKDNVNVLTGNTGVGKTTIINYLSKDLNLKTQEISQFLKRGKHTTTNITIYELFKNSFFIDTPGFSIFQVDMNKIDIAHNFLNFSKYVSKCKFSNCLHINEIGCNVKGKISAEKYNNYLKFINEFK